MQAYSNRGKGLEELIEWANKAYLKKDIALVTKVPTPTKVIRKGNKIASAFFEAKSILDYVGVVDTGIPIAFDAKQTREKYFPLRNLKQHQMDFMERWKKYGGLAFLVVEFVQFEKIYRIEYEYIKFYWDQWQENKGRRGYAHIPMREFEQNGRLLRARKGIPVDYLEGVY